MKSLHLSLLLFSASALCQTPEMPPPAAGKIDFELQVEPILSAKCYGCHGPGKQLAGLRLDRRQQALRGGDYGKVLIPGDSANSKLIHRLTGGRAGMQMPPSGPLEVHEISILRAWIDQGPDYGSSQLTRRIGTARKPVSPALAGLIDAVVANDLVALRATLATNPGLTAEIDAAGSTALMHAAGRGSIGAMELLLNAGAPLDTRNLRGATALTWALASPAKVKLLLDAGASVNGRTNEGRTPLHIAAQQPGLPETFRLIMAKGADVGAMDVAGFTPLHLAATAGSEEFVRVLLAAGAKVNAVTGNGSTPLILAAMSGASGCVRLLLDRGADASIVTKKNISALAPAAYWGDLDVMRQLIAKGAPVQLADTDGWAPLTHAAYSEVTGPAAVRLLLEHGAVALPTADGETPLSLASKRGAIDVVRILNEAGNGQSRLKAAIARAFAPLEKQSPNFVRIGGCNSCHNQDLPLFAQAIAKQRGIPAGGEIVLAPAPPDFERVFEHSGLLGASSIGYSVMSMTAQQRPADAKTDAMVNYLIGHQEADGRWASRSNRQPLTTGDHHSTAFGIFVLRSYGRPAGRAEIDGYIGRAVAWLQEHPPVSTQDAAMQVLGMAWGGAGKDVIAKAASALRDRQGGEGGWSQLPVLGADAYATGQALYAFASAGVPASDAACRKGVAFLLRTQAADGTWHVKARSKPLQPYFESGFPYGQDQWMSAAGTSWAAMALSMAVEPVVATAKR